MDKIIQFLDDKPDTLVLDPHTVDDVVQNVIDIAKKVGKENEGLEIKTSLIRKIENIVSASKDKKPVICLEWFDPFYMWSLGSSNG